jgi:hypothetical protein
LSSLLMSGRIKLECLSLASLSSLNSYNTNLLGPFVSNGENEVS